MDSDKYSRNITLICPTCGGTQFEYEEMEIDDDNAEVHCISCDRRMTKSELVQANAINIDVHTKEIGEEVVNDAAKELTETLKNAFKGNKHIKIK